MRRLSSFPSMMSWIWFAFVCALNVLLMLVHLLRSCEFRACLMYTVFPVPVGPPKRTCLPCVVSKSNR